MIKNIVLDNGNVVHYVNDINKYKPLSIPMSIFCFHETHYNNGGVKIMK